jgi:hypothetical protein
MILVPDTLIVKLLPSPTLADAALAITLAVPVAGAVYLSKKIAPPVTL